MKYQYFISVRVPRKHYERGDGVWPNLPLMREGGMHYFKRDSDIENPNKSDLIKMLDIGELSEDNVFKFMEIEKLA